MNSAPNTMVWEWGDQTGRCAMKQTKPKEKDDDDVSDTVCQTDVIAPAVLETRVTVMAQKMKWLAYPEQETLDMLLQLDNGSQGHVSDQKMQELKRQRKCLKKLLAVKKKQLMRHNQRILMGAKWNMGCHTLRKNMEQKIRSFDAIMKQLKATASQLNKCDVRSGSDDEEAGSSSSPNEGLKFYNSLMKAKGFPFQSEPLPDVKH